MNAAYTGISHLKLVGYAYLLNLKQAATASTATYGARAEWRYLLSDVFATKLDGAFAHQTDYGDNPNAVSLNFWMLKGGIEYQGLAAEVGYKAMQGNGVVQETRPTCIIDTATSAIAIWRCAEFQHRAFSNKIGALRAPSDSNGSPKIKAPEHHRHALAVIRERGHENLAREPCPVLCLYAANAPCGSCWHARLVEDEAPARLQVLGRCRANKLSAHVANDLFNLCSCETDKIVPLGVHLPRLRHDNIAYERLHTARRQIASRRHSAVTTRDVPIFVGLASHFSLEC
jgi:hypothetical protein